MMRIAVIFVALLLPVSILAACGDPQVMTDHPWYPGELSCSTFERLFKTEAELYKRVVGRVPESDEDKALAAWYWRNLHYAHGEEGNSNYFGQGFNHGEKNYEYWTGLFAHGFGLCGTTHAQWTVELDRVLGHGRSRVVGVPGHNSFEVFLSGGAYGDGHWALLDHDISTVIYNSEGSRLLSIQEIMADLKTLKDPKFKPERQHGWRVAGLEDGDAAAYTGFNTAEYLAGYSGPPPRVHLRAGESLRRYINPGLEDGKTFVFWGRNYRAEIPGLQRDRTWVNQPEKMYGSTKGTGWSPGKARFANAVYTYTPDFAAGTYKEGVIDEGADHVTFEFYTPFVIAATPPNDKDWGVYDSGATNGLVITGQISFATKVSVNQGKTWTSFDKASSKNNQLDLTDIVKGAQQYWLRFDAVPPELAKAAIRIRTVCQANAAIIPHLHDGENKITYWNSGNALVSAGPNKDQAEPHVVDGSFGGKQITLEISTPRGEIPTHLYTSSWVSSGVPPDATHYQIEWSGDGGKTWQPVVKDWQIQRHSPDPPDFWSQSFCFGDAALNFPDGKAGPIRVRFSNDGGKTYRKAEAHLAYRAANPQPVTVTFAWTEAGGQPKTATHEYGATPDHEDSTWQIKTGEKVNTLWVDFAVK